MAMIVAHPDSLGCILMSTVRLMLKILLNLLIDGISFSGVKEWIIQETGGECT